jgi:hypothetical protein
MTTANGHKPITETPAAQPPSPSAVLSEINVFSDGRWHVKLVGVPAEKTVKHLQALTKAIADAGITIQETAAASPPAASCPTHGPSRTKPSKHVPDGLYCAGRVGNAYCSWSYDPAKSMRGDR